MTVIGKHDITVNVVGYQSYLLQVETKELAISRPLNLEVTTGEKFGVLQLVPDRTLPNTIIEAIWAVRDVASVHIGQGSNDADTGSLLNVTNQTTGYGKWKFILNEQTQDKSIFLSFTPLSGSEHGQGAAQTISASPRIWGWEPRQIQDEDGAPLKFASFMSTSSEVVDFAYGNGRLAIAKKDGTVWPSSPSWARHIFRCDLNENNTSNAAGTLSLPCQVADKPEMNDPRGVVFVNDMGLALNRVGQESDVYAYQGELYILNDTDKKYYPLGTSPDDSAAVTQEQLQKNFTDHYKLSQDWFYNPQINRWQLCGHSFNFAGFTAVRHGGSARIWCLGGGLLGQPASEDDPTQLYTLSIPSGSLSTADYIEGNQSVKLPLATEDKYAGVFLKHIQLHDGYPLAKELLVQGYLSYISFQNMDLTGFNFSQSYLESVDLSGAVLTNANLQGADLRFCLGLDKATLSGARYDADTLWPEEFKYQNSGAFGPGAHLFNIDLSGADLAGINFSGAVLDGADLTDAINLDEVYYDRNTK